MGAEDPQNVRVLCRDCGNDVTALIAAGESICPNCGSAWETTASDEKGRGGLWLLFFAIFLGTPVLTLLSLRSGALSVLILPFGAFFAGSVLSQLFVRDTAARAVMTVVFGFMVLVVYAGIVFVGCLASLKNI